MKEFKKKKGKKAWLRIVEALLAIVILSSGLLVIISNHSKDFNNSGEVYKKQREILNIISKNYTLREKIISANDGTQDLNEVNDSISKLVLSSWDFRTKICSLESICNHDETPNDRNVYVTEIVIASTLKEYSPRKLRFFVWKK